ncbi:hypothetical protein ABVT39_020500, partial [Epinephelus coioides]
ENHYHHCYDLQPSDRGFSPPDKGLTKTSWGVVMLHFNQAHESEPPPSPTASCLTRTQSPQRQKLH